VTCKQKCPTTTSSASAPARPKLARSFLLKRRSPTLQLKVVRLSLDSLDITEAMPIFSSADGWPEDDGLVDVIAAANMPIVQPVSATGRHKVVCNSATVSWLRGLGPAVVGYPAIINCLMIVEPGTEHGDAENTESKESHPAMWWRVADQWLSDYVLGRLPPELSAEAAKLLKKSSLKEARRPPLRDRLKALIRP
jgi:hypothetical protein